MSKNRSFEKGFAPLIPVLVVAAILLLSFSIKNFQNQTGSINGKTSVLSESDSGGGSDSGKGGSDSSGSSGGGSSTSGSGSTSTSGSGASGETKTTAPTFTTGRTSVQTTSRLESEIKTPEPSEKPEKIETPEPKETPEAEIETEVETEIKDGTLSAKIKIRSGTNKSEFEQEGSNVQVQGGLPVNVNKTTDELTVTTPAGVKTVTVLPDTAVQNILGAGIVSQVASDSATGKNAVTLTTDANGNLIYEINGVKFEKLLGLINVGIDKTAQVSATNGQVGTISQSFLSRLLDILSI